MRGATIVIQHIKRVFTISIHAPHAGCDPCTYLFFCLAFISIHAPHAGCDFVVRAFIVSKKISIHAPHAGCDACSFLHSISPVLFQSTHPMRGATSAQSCYCAFQMISIHAPHAGCDYNRFHVITIVCISIHAPHAGCDEHHTKPRGANHGISIHAPHAGCDEILCHPWTLSQYFNPRTPCGVRPGLSVC